MPVERRMAMAEKSKAIRADTGETELPAILLAEYTDRVPARDRLPPAATDVRRAGGVVELDWVKGLAILGVLLIHSEVFVSSAWGQLLIHRSVPVLIVLFGTTSELWWRRESSRADGSIVWRWYRMRFTRLMVPVWVMLAALWSVRIAIGDPAATPAKIAVSLTGYMPTVGTGWFVTLALELVILFPLLRLLVRTLGATVCVVLSAIVVIVSFAHLWDIIAVQRWVLRDSLQNTGGMAIFYYFWIFPPLRLFSVICGMLIADRHVQISKTVALASLSTVVAGNIVAARIEPLYGQALLALLDVPLTMAALVGAQVLRNAHAIARALAWYGRNSWEIYLAQLFLHETTQLFTLPGVGSYKVRTAYFLFLLFGATGLVSAEQSLRSRRRVAASDTLSVSSDYRA
jgi:peptidoglycan/LPS O-acetylase OafA/YrhL